MNRAAPAISIAAAQRRFKPYPAYKDSGVEWLGEIPAHWEVGRLKYLASLNEEALPENTDPDFDMVYVDISSVDSTRGILGKEPLIFAKAPSRARRMVRAGDVIVSTVRTYLRAIAPIVEPESNLVVSTGFAVVRPRRGLETTFAAYALRAPYFVDRVVAHSVGVSYPAINESEMGTFRLAVPPIPEQRAIAAFLDRETARIDALVAKKERLIELLQEKRTALITRAVTKGLDPNVPMKDSDVEWLGEIPAHWTTRKFAWLITSSNAGEVIDRSYWHDGGELLYSCQRNPMRSTFDRFPVNRRTEPGDLLVTRNGTPYVHLPEPGSIYTNVVQRVKLAPELATGYALLMLSQAAQSLIGFGDIIESFNMSTWRSLVLPVPSLATQSQIQSYVKQETPRIDALVAKVRAALDRLKELRTALISAAVTGKIDVREHAA
ncbi:MAG: restriction endonuclease subunit S [bacterium]|nr:restriction endonuclease subunit S [bacterium]